MSEKNIDLLKDEYSKLFGLFEKHWMMPYNVIPLAVTIAGAFTLYGTTNKGLLGVVVSYGIVLLVAWLAYVHVFTNGIGLRLLDLECKINSANEATAGEGLGWFSQIMASANTHVVGLWRTHIIASVFGFIILIAAQILGWAELRQFYALQLKWCVLVMGCPIILIASLLLNMRHVELETRKRKNELLVRYNRILGNETKEP